MSPPNAQVAAAGLAALAALGAACKQLDLSDQPREETLQPSRFFEDGQSARTPVPGTVPRGALRLDEHLYDGVVAGEPAETFPFEIERSDLDRGRERYEALCAPCHGYVGEGDGMVVQRGFPRPPSLLGTEVRALRPGDIYVTIARGAGAMPSYSTQTEPEDRWRIVAYVEALQRSQFAGEQDVPEEVWARLVRGDDAEE